MTAPDVTTAVERVRAAVAAAASSWDTQVRVDVDDLIKLTDELDRLSAALGEAREALIPFSTVGRIINGPYKPLGDLPDDGVFQSGAAWTVNGEKRTLTWGDFRRADRARTALQQQEQ